MNSRAKLFWNDIMPFEIKNTFSKFKRVESLINTLLIIISFESSGLQH